jgi:hypothetical protein
MNSKTIRLFCGLAAAIVLNLTSPRAGATVIAFGEVVDPLGDSFAVDPLGDVIAGGTDLSSASISVDDLGNVTFTVHYSAASFSPPDSGSVFSLDLDSNPATGDTNPATPGVGPETLLRLPGAGMHTTAQVLTWNGPTSSYILSPTDYAFSTLADGYTATLPLSALGTTSPHMNFAVTAGTYLSATTSTGIQDYANIGTVASVPDHGSTALLLGVTLLGALGVARRVR